jgi:peptidoglycan/LPS O-acetylase OafA/YrhL
VDRLRGIDGLRGIAAAIVFLCHARAINALDVGPLNPFVAGGTNGVLLFFAISGYLLYRPFLRGDVNLTAYGIRRVLRVWPGYVVALVGLAALTGSEVPTQHPLEFVTLTQYLHPELINQFLSPAWTLWVEICFYLALPLVAWLLSLVPARQRVTALLLIALGSVSLRVITIAFMSSRPDPASWGALLYAMPALFWAFVPGMILATLEADGRLRIGARGALAGVAVFALGAYVQMPLFDLISSAGAFLIVGYCARLNLPRRLATVAAAAGAVSYGVYLWHGELLLWIAGQVGNPWLSIAIAGSLTVLFAAMCYVLVERPAMRFARRIPAEPLGILVSLPLRRRRTVAAHPEQR